MRNCTPQKLFFMIKPDGIPLERQIIKKVEPLVTIVAARLFEPVPREKIENLYSMHRDKPFYPYLMDYFDGKPAKAFVLAERPGRGAHESFYKKFLEIVGDTNPGRARPGTIRALSSDSLQSSMSEKRAVRNLVHRSTNHEETQREAAIFFWDYLCCQEKVRGVRGRLGPFLAREGVGIFYEERLEYALRKRDLLLPDEALLSYQDIDGQGKDLQSRKAGLIEIEKNGKVEKRTITLSVP